MTTVVSDSGSSRSVSGGSHRSFCDRSFRTRVSEYAGQNCPTVCRCSCHRRTLLSTPWVTRNLVGKLSVTYTGLSFLGTPCTVKTCRRSLMSSLRIDYALPIWIANRMLSVWYKSAPITGPELLLKTRRIVQTNAYFLAQMGELEGLKYLYTEWEASVHDVDIYTGNNALTVFNEPSLIWHSC